MAVDLSMPVLVVDDYKTMIRIIRNLLKQLGFSDVDDAADGIERSTAISLSIHRILFNSAFRLSILQRTIKKASNCCNCVMRWI